MRTVISNGREWMAEDVRVGVDGRIYLNWEEAKANCPEGWRIPTLEDWGSVNIGKLEIGWNGCKYDLNKNADHVGRSYYWSSSPYFWAQGIEGTEKTGIYIKGGSFKQEPFYDDIFYPLRYVRDHIPATYVVFFGMFDFDDNYVTSIAYAGNDKDKAYSFFNHPDIDSISVWENGSEVRVIEVIEK